MGDVRKSLFREIATPKNGSVNKVTIVGAGQVGMACAFSILTQNVTNHLCLIDPIETKLKGETMDLRHGSTFLKGAKIESGTDCEASAGSKIVIITAGARQNEGESRRDLVQRNVDIFKKLIPSLARSSPDGVFLVVSNPVDVLTYLTWKLSGFSQNRVMGSGTNLDTSRFRVLLSERLGVSPTSCHGWIIGEHGDASVAVWSGVNVAGVRLQDVDPSAGLSKDDGKWGDIHRQVIESAYQVIRLKGYTSWAIGLSVSSLVASILQNTKNIHAVSTNVKGHYGIENDIFLSVPCVLGAEGVTHTVTLPLNQQEEKSLKVSAQTLQELQTQISL